MQSRISEQIARGHPPDSQVVADVVAPDAAVLGAEGLAETRRGLADDLLGAGPLQPLLADPVVTDVLVNGDGAVWVDRGAGLVRGDAEVGSAGAVGDARAVGLALGVDGTRRLAVRLAGLAGRRLDDSQPWVDGLLPGGIRLHAVLPPVVDGGAHISLRIPRRSSTRLADLASAGLCGPQVATVLAGLVRGRVSCVITGGTGSGKTTLLGAMLAEVPTSERVVLVEDVRELSVDHPHVVRLQGRAPNVEGRGAVTLVDLVRQALRMRPDRLVVGEVRGAEVRELLAALNTGHEGGCGTLHANSPEDVPARFEALGALAGLDRAAVHAQLVSAVRVVVHLGRTPRGRRVASVSVLVPSAGGVGCLPALSALPDDRVEQGPGWAELARLVGTGTPGGWAIR